MIAQLPLTTYFPEGVHLDVPHGVCHPFEPLESSFEGSTCFILFSLGLLKGQDVELTAWHEQVTGGDLERVMPVYDGSEWQAETRN